MTLINEPLLPQPKKRHEGLRKMMTNSPPPLVNEVPNQLVSVAGG
jgi:hypothetical protein